MITAYHAQYFAYELTRQHPTDSLQKMTAILSDAQVELNPHQVEAALFAFQSPLSKGAILADEVGLGKTIEAGLVLSQRWAEMKRRLLIIAPANLRKQWSQELSDKFFLPSLILEKSSYDAAQRAGQTNPFDQENMIVICSYQFARSKSQMMRRVAWDLAVIDEAHRLRNAWRPENKIGNAIKNALQEHPKLLLTATPLQNSLIELFGLVGIIDEHVFGDLQSFRTQFAKLTDEVSFAALRQRIQPICKRTLRRQVLEYVSYTNRIPITQEFVLSEDEHKLHSFVNDYLQEEKLFALPSGQRPLTTLILRKLLASSTFAISATLGRMADRLERQAMGLLQPDEDVTDLLVHVVEDEEEDVEDFVEDFTMDDTTDPDATDENAAEAPPDPKALRAEVSRLRSFQALSENIASNSKGEVLKIALEKGFDKLAELGAARKAIIFTESIRTQQYLKMLLEAYGFAGQLVLFNGSNKDLESQEIYRKWVERHKDTDMISGSRTADTRAALTEYFRNEATIMIATEAAAEGINLQFCSLVVNYDLPWNPQRIEQRIGRCHRYGQLHDVVVINFLNKDSETEVRIFEILEQKFKLFSGVFGASDEVLGSLDSGVDFEKRIADIYQNCRSREEISQAFDALKSDLEPAIGAKMDETRQQLLENFDEEVVEKLRISLDQSMEYINRYEQLLWRCSHWYLQDYADFEGNRHVFNLRENPFPEIEIPAGKYRFAKNVTDAHRYRAGHPLAKAILDACKFQRLPPAALVFEYRDIKPKITVLKNRIGTSGWLQLDLLAVTAFDREEQLVFTVITDDGEVVSEPFAQRLFSLSAHAQDDAPVYPGDEVLQKLNEEFDKTRDAIIAANNTRTAKFFDYEIEKLERWADDVKSTLEIELKEMDREIAFLKGEAKKSPDVEVMLRAQKQIKELERVRKEKRQQLFREQDGVEDQKDRLMENIQARLNRHLVRKHLFMLRWRLE